MDAGIVDLLLVNGAVVLVLGLLAGFAYWLTIVLPGAESAERKYVQGRWRVAHVTIVLFGVVLFVVRLLLPDLALPPGQLAVMAWSLVAAGYAFTFALTLGAALENRALTPWPLGLTTVLFAGHLIGAVGSTLGAVLLLYGLLR